MNNVVLNSMFENMYLCMYYRYPFVMKKVFNFSELHFSEVTSYKIHILADSCIEHIIEGEQKKSRQTVLSLEAIS